MRAHNDEVTGMKAYFVPFGIFGGELIGIDRDNLDENGNFSMNYMGPGKYGIMTELVAIDDYRIHQFWEFTVNDASVTHELNICGNVYNDYHKIRIVGATMWLPSLPRVQGLDEAPPDPCE